jgi:hypothetical protein
MRSDRLCHVLGVKQLDRLHDGRRLRQFRCHSFVPATPTASVRSVDAHPHRDADAVEPGDVGKSRDAEL